MSGIIVSCKYCKPINTSLDQKLNKKAICAALADAAVFFGIKRLHLKKKNINLKVNISAIKNLPVCLQVRKKKKILLFCQKLIHKYFSRFSKTLTENTKIILKKKQKKKNKKKK